MLFSSDLSLSAESDQETASLTIDKSPDKCEVGRFVLTIKLKIGKGLEDKKSSSGSWLFVKVSSLIAKKTSLSIHSQNV